MLRHGDVADELATGVAGVFLQRQCLAERLHP
jgi:hypothetical protein